MKTNYSELRQRAIRHNQTAPATIEDLNKIIVSIEIKESIIERIVNLFTGKRG